MGPKSKTQKMSLGTFLGDQSLGSWADEMEDMPMPSYGSGFDRSRSGYGGERREYSSRPGFGGDRDYGDRGFLQREQLPLPTKPPFTAHMGNLSFDVTVADVEDFFAACSVTNVRIVEDKLDHKPKGFGYVEFATLEGLKKALEASGTQFQGRNIRVSVAEPPKDRAEGRELNDWTRKGPLPDIPQNTRRGSERGGFRGFDSAASDAGSDRGERRRVSGYEQSDGKTRDFGNWERKGPLSPAPAPPPTGDNGRVRRNETSFERRPSPSWGEGQSQDGSRPQKREYQERPRAERAERVPTAAELDNQWRTKMQPDKPVTSPVATPEASVPSSPAVSVAAPAAPAAPAQRPRLNLQKRTVSEAPTEESASASGDPKASPFGAARPIDTAAREREIEEKRLAVRQKKAQEDKEREEKRVAAEKQAKLDAAAAKAADKGSSDNPTTPATPSAPKENGKENGSSAAQPGRNYEILRRMTDQENGGEVDEVVDGDGPANGETVEDKAVKPSEVIVDPATSPGAEGDTTAENLEEAGWETVSKPERKRKNGNQPARAVAS